MRLLIFLPIYLVLASDSNALTVEEAYMAIPHRQTTFRVAESTVESSESGYLAKFFALTDRAMKARVETLQWFSSNGRFGGSFDQYKKELSSVIEELSSLSPPEKGRKAYELVRLALGEQMEAFEAWDDERKGGGRFSFAHNRSHPKVQSSHTKLISAYESLMRAYPNESKHNLQAFFDHLCALDFI